MYPQLMYQDVDFTDTLAITKAWLADREALLEECEKLRGQRDKARHWARLWKAAAWIMRQHYIRTSEYLEQERDDHKTTRDYMNTIRDSRYSR